MVGETVIEHRVGCGVGRTWPRPNRHGQDFGGAGGGALRGEERSQWGAFARSQLDLFESFRTPSDDRPCLIDVGGSVGALVQVATVRLGRSLVFEPDWEACVLARRYSPVVNSYFPITSVLRNKAHAVVLRHVLEHVDDPSRYLQGIFVAMAPQGMLLVVCPNNA
jgi:hypothetical protein